MRIVAGIFGIIGALAGGFLGLKWWGDLHSDLAKAATALAGMVGKNNELTAELASMQRGTYALLFCAVLGLAVSVMVFMRKGNKLAMAALLILAGILPMFFTGKAAFGIPMALGGLFALGIKQTAAASSSKAAATPVVAPPA